MNEVRDVLSEAGSTVDQLREQLRVSEVRCNELFAYGQFMERQLIEAKAELSRVGAELSSQQLTFQEINAALQECQSSNNALMFQLNQTRVESQIKDREIQRLRSAAPCASTSGSPPKPPKSQPRLLVRCRVLVRCLGFTLKVLLLHLSVRCFPVPLCLLLYLLVKFLPSQLHRFQTLAWIS